MGFAQAEKARGVPAIDADAFDAALGETVRKPPPAGRTSRSPDGAGSS